MLNSLFISLCFFLLNTEFHCQIHSLDAQQFQFMISIDTIALKLTQRGSLIYIHPNVLKETKSNFIHSVNIGKIVYQKIRFINRIKMIKRNNRLAFSGIALVEGIYENQSFQVKLTFTPICKKNQKIFQLIYWLSTTVTTQPQK